ncbi:MAG: sigma-70 family RNA polymerase sigma factor [Candidatus Glassbacteria bacterium]|nr:sigma-70 family RNA polymerase sigma factor [Candidatus Glassbacteria bacterium]
MGSDPGSESRQDDMRLVERALGGDQGAFRELYELYNQKIYRLVGSMVGQVEDVHDIVQEAFVRVFRSLKSFKAQSSFYTWLYRIAINVTTDYRRKQARRRQRLTERPLEEVDQGASQITAPASENPENELYRRELASLVDKALGTLSDEHRRVLVLREINGLSYQEIAEVTETTIGTVMSRIHYGRGKLAETLRKWDAIELGNR